MNKSLLQASAPFARTVASVSFWIQLALSLAAVGILIFSSAFSGQVRASLHLGGGEF
jgi:hypothetical protein